MCTTNGGGELEADVKGFVVAVVEEGVCEHRSGKGGLEDSQGMEQGEEGGEGGGEE